MTEDGGGDPDAVVHLRVDQQVATVTLDSPHNRNALSRALCEQLVDRLAAAAASDARVVVLTHTGTTFCAGADLTEALDEGMAEGTRRLLGLLRTIAEHPMPVVAVVKGHVRAGGLGLVGACDVAVVTRHSTFAFTETLLGLAPAIISLSTRTRMSERDTARKFLTGTTFDGGEAARCGLVTQVVPADAVEAATVSLVAEFTKASPQGLRETKRLLNRDLLRRLDTEGEEMIALSARLFASDEAREGMQAFRQRRLPNWS